MLERTGQWTWERPPNPLLSPPPPPLPPLPSSRSPPTQQTENQSPIDTQTNRVKKKTYQNTNLPIRRVSGNKSLSRETIFWESSENLPRIFRRVFFVKKQVLWDGAKTQEWGAEEALPRGGVEREGSIQFPKVLGLLVAHNKITHHIPGCASQLVTMHIISADLFQSHVFESVHLHGPWSCVVSTSSWQTRAPHGPSRPEKSTFYVHAHVTDIGKCPSQKISKPLFFLHCWAGNFCNTNAFCKYAPKTITKQMLLDRFLTEKHEKQSVLGLLDGKPLQNKRFLRWWTENHYKTTGSWTSGQPRKHYSTHGFIDIPNRKSSQQKKVFHVLKNKCCRCSTCGEKRRRVRKNSCARSLSHLSSISFSPPLKTTLTEKLIQLRYWKHPENGLTQKLT